MSRSILITGGTGSFGQAFVQHLLKSEDFNRIIVFSRNEHTQAAMAQNYIKNPEHSGRLRFFIGDVRDKDRLRRAFRGVDTIIHAAALKRIEVGNYNPTEMVKTNVIGTMNVVEVAEECSVRRVVGISSDKAWQPISPYGQSKALAETIMLSANNTTNKDFGPSFAVVRYGNVAGSAGSIIPKWRELLKSSPLLPVTDPDCTRFWMFMDEAVNFVHQAMFHTKVDKVFVPKLPAFRIGDLALVMGAKGTYHTGLPPWEKKHEGMEDGNTSDIAHRMTNSELQSCLALV